MSSGSNSGSSPFQADPPPAPCGGVAEVLGPAAEASADLAAGVSCVHGAQFHSMSRWKATNDAPLWSPLASACRTDAGPAVSSSTACRTPQFPSRPSCPCRPSRLCVQPMLPETCPRVLACCLEASCKALRCTRGFAFVTANQARYVSDSLASRRRLCVFVLSFKIVRAAAAPSLLLLRPDVRVPLAAHRPCRQPNMLKRPRGSSPSPPMPDPTVEADVAPYDLYEPDAKRRRYFAPARYGHRSRDEEEEGEDDAELSDGPRASSSRHEETKARRREWQLEAGEYRDANSLLHDLHAEQRHRLLFSSPPPGTSSPSSYHQHYTPESTPFVRSQEKGIPAPVEKEHLRTVAPPIPASHDPLVKERHLAEEASVVSQRYEDVNRCVYTFLASLLVPYSSRRILRALVLSRRGGGEPEPPSIS